MGIEEAGKARSGGVRQQRTHGRHLGGVDFWELGDSRLTKSTENYDVRY